MRSGGSTVGGVARPGVTERPASRWRTGRRRRAGGLLALALLACASATPGLAQAEPVTPPAEPAAAPAEPAAAPAEPAVARTGAASAPADSAAARTEASAALAAPAATPTFPSPRNASYTIEVRLDPAARTLDGHEVIRWRNLQATPADELWFHLYWNAWRNSHSTWMREDRYRERSDHGEEIAEGDWSYVEVEAARLLAAAEHPGADLTAALRPAAPDDGNPEDRTVLVVRLPQPVPPGGEAGVEIAWHAKVPRTFARTGFRGDFFFLAQWFPKLGVYEEGGWNCHQFHASTEFYSDYGVYDVSMTVPAGYKLGATGRQVERREEPDGAVTYRFVEGDVHDFVWTTSPSYEVMSERFEEPGLPPVDMRLLIQPEHRRQARRHFDATRAALKYYGTWYGPYPYGHVTIVDPAYGSGAGGMEYPTLFTAGTRLFNPPAGGSPEGVTIHEAGHQFWYALVGNNEFEDAWLDEGLNTFSTLRTHYAAYGEHREVERYFTPPGTEVRGFFPVVLDGFRYVASPTYGERMRRYRPAAESDAEATPTYLYHPGTGYNITYSKTALWLATLEGYLGWDRLDAGMSAFFEHWRYRHPRPQDFFDALSAAAGEDLTWFFDQVYRGSDSFDYAVDSVASEPAAVEGLVEEGGQWIYRPPAEDDEEEDDGAGDRDSELYRSEVVVRRLGGAVFPVDLLMVFEDGEQVRHRWDGRARWHLFVEERPAKLEYAVVDPDNILLLDLDRTNNSRRLESKARFPALKWASRWLVWFEDYLATCGFFV